MTAYRFFPVKSLRFPSHYSDEISDTAQSMADDHQQQIVQIVDVEGNIRISFH